MRKLITFFGFAIAFVVVMYFAGQDNSVVQPGLSVKSVEYEIRAKNARIAELRDDSLAFRQKMTSDSLKNIVALTALKAEINRLKRNASKIDFKRASASHLDSVVSVLYPSSERPR